MEHSIWKTMWKEIRHDKVAMVGLIVFTIMILLAYIWPFFIDEAAWNAARGIQFRMQPPAPGAPLGYDNVGRTMLEHLILATRNSFSIAFLVSIGSVIIGTIFGLFAGYYGGFVDWVLMRFLDFFTMIPSIMFIIIIVVTINPGVVGFSIMLVTFGWMGTARLMRSMALRQGSLEYVSASKTLGTPNIIILFREVTPNLVSIITANFTFVLAFNMGIEVGLTMLGLGLPQGVHSLGHLIEFGRYAQNLQFRWWLWLPASIIVILAMLCVNFVGQALNRAADAKKRRA